MIVDGARLQLAARHVFIDDKNLPEITALTIAASLDFFTQFKINWLSRRNCSKNFKRSYVVV